MIFPEDEEFLAHYGKKGMKWGVRKAPTKLSIKSTDSAPTRRTKKDYNTQTNKEFLQKHAVTKKRYAKRVEKYGDPAKNSLGAKIGPKLPGSKKYKPVKGLAGDASAVGAANVKTMAPIKTGFGQKQTEKIILGAKNLNAKKIKENIKAQDGKKLVKDLVVKSALVYTFKTKKVG